MKCNGGREWSIYAVLSLSSALSTMGLVDPFPRVFNTFSTRLPDEKGFCAFCSDEEDLEWIFGKTLSVYKFQ